MPYFAQFIVVSYYIILHSSTKGLNCYSCSKAETNDICILEGTVETCIGNKICQNEIYDENGVHRITKVCKQEEKCTKNAEQNVEFCFSHNTTSTCVYCCSTDLCNEFEVPSDSCTLGIENETLVTPEQLTASSNYSDIDSASNGRLYGTRSWAAVQRLTLDEWIQVDLLSIKRITGVIMQGSNTRSNGYSEWVTTYKVLYRLDNTSDLLLTVPGENGNDAYFRGNCNTYSPVTNMFCEGIFARFVRIQPTSFTGWISLRFELLRCTGTCTDSCIGHIGIEEGGSVPSESITASSVHPDCATEHSRLNSVAGLGAWSPNSTVNEWIQVDLGSEMNITGIITQGSSRMDEWVRMYQVYYSTDNTTFHKIGPSENFKGNWDQSTDSTYNFCDVLTAKIIRIYPTYWNEKPSLRFELRGCTETDFGTSILAEDKSDFDLSTQETKNESKYRKHLMVQQQNENSGYQYHVVRSLYTPSIVRCVVQCMAEPLCVTIHFGTGKCHLNSENKDYQTQNLINMNYYVPI